MNHQPESLMGLLRSRRFLPLFITQFLGALNDNVLKNAMVVLLTFQAAQWSNMAPELLANLAAGIFILPFFMCSATAGQLADKFNKASIARWVKLFEIIIVLVAGLGFALHSIEVLFLALFLLGLHSSVFGPVKYAILPQHLASKELIGGNALIEAGTFVAILLGTVLGGLVASLPNAGWFITLAGLVIAIAGYLASWFIPYAAPPVPNLPINLNLWSETLRNMQFAFNNRLVFLCITGISWFWLYGALFLTQFPAFAKHILGGDESVVTLLLVVFTLGVGVGSLWCNRLCSSRINLYVVLLGSVGLTLFGLDLAYASSIYAEYDKTHHALAMLYTMHGLRILADLFLLGVCGGLYIVPLYSLLLKCSSNSHRARTISANNIFNALFMVVGALYASALLSFGFSIHAMFAITAIFNAFFAAYFCKIIWVRKGIRKTNQFH